MSSRAQLHVRLGSFFPHARQCQFAELLFGRRLQSCHLPPRPRGPHLQQTQAQQPAERMFTSSTSAPICCAIHRQSARKVFILESTHNLPVRSFGHDAPGFSRPMQKLTLARCSRSRRARARMPHTRPLLRATSRAFAPMTGSKLPARAATLLEFAKVWNGSSRNVANARREYRGFFCRRASNSRSSPSRNSSTCITQAS